MRQGRAPTAGSNAPASSRAIRARARPRGRSRRARVPSTRCRRRTGDPGPGRAHGDTAEDVADQSTSGGRRAVPLGLGQHVDQMGVPPVVPGAGAVAGRRRVRPRHGPVPVHVRGDDRLLGGCGALLRAERVASMPPSWMVRADAVARCRRAREALESGARWTTLPVVDPSPDDPLPRRAGVTRDGLRHVGRGAASHGGHGTLRRERVRAGESGPRRSRIATCGGGDATLPDDRCAPDHLDPPLERPAGHHPDDAAHRLHHGAGDLEPAAPVFLSWSIPEAVVGPVSAVLGIAIATILSMILGELVPKNFALAVPRQAAKLVMPFQVAFTTVFRPAVAVLNGSANGVLRAVGVEPKEELSARGRRRSCRAWSAAPPAPACSRRTPPRSWTAASPSPG